MARTLSTTIALGVILGLASRGSSARQDGPATAKDAKARGERLLALHEGDAATYAIYRDPDRMQKLELRREPIYRWTNPTRVGGQEGDVFLWTYKGRPEAVASIFSHPHHDGKQRVVCHELHSLSEATLVVDRVSANQWKPEAPGVEMKPIDGAPAPASSPAQRLVQIRAMAREFAGRSLSDQGQKWELRLLPRPLYRYESTDPDVIDGAVFALVSSAGTDPEIILVIEARKRADGPRWEFAAARFSDMNLWLTHKGKEVWSSIRGGENTFDHDAKHRFRFYQDRFIPEIVPRVAASLEAPPTPRGGDPMRRESLVPLALFLPALLGQSPPAGDEGKAAADAARAKREACHRIYLREAEGYTIFRDSGRSEAVALKPDPVYVWTNPVRDGGQDGEVYVWTCRGRAEVVGTFFSFPAAGPRGLHHELHALSTTTLAVTRPGAHGWEPKGPGLELAAIAEASAPGRSASSRMSQMRSPRPRLRGHHRGRQGPQVGAPHAASAALSLSEHRPRRPRRRGLRLRDLRRHRPGDAPRPGGAQGPRRAVDDVALRAGPLHGPEIGREAQGRGRPRGAPHPLGFGPDHGWPLPRLRRPQDPGRRGRGPLGAGVEPRAMRDHRSHPVPAVYLLLLTLVTTSASSPADATGLSGTGSRRALVVCGLPGDDEHRDLYAKAVEKIAKALVETSGFDAKDVWVRFGVEAKESDGPALKGSRGLSTRENLASDVEAIRVASKPEDALWVIVVGHAHFDGRHAHLNLPGPDLSDVAFARMFAGITAGEQVFFVTTQASGFFLKPLAAPGRIAISATEADQEVNETLYPLALADVLASPPKDADRDKDGVFSVFDLYLAVVADVMKNYADDELIATEHALIDDNGDGHGSEVQLRFLPPDSGGEEPKEAKPKDKAKAKPKAPEPKVEPTLGPKDDGFLASKVRVNAPKPRAADAGGSR